jgi:RNA polymerase sigma-70 factor (ECF subfamily)
MAKTEQERLFKELTGEDFSKFYQKFYSRLVFNLNGITKDEHRAEDIATTAFLKALEKIDTYNEEKAQFSTWLFIIGRRMAFQSLKERANKYTISLDNEFDEEGTTLKDFLFDEESNDEFLFTLNNKKAEIIKREINNLKKPHREVIEMRELQNMQYKDIACAMGKDVEFKISIDDDGFCNFPTEISKIYSVKDVDHNEVEFELIKGEHFYEKIRISKGDYFIKGREPKNLSTIKSQIKSSREKLIKATEKEFRNLESSVV